MNEPPETVTDQVERERNARKGGMKIWVPGMKLPERVKELAAVFFVEAWKSTLARGLDVITFRDNAEKNYQDCVAMARVLVEIDNTEVPR
jgi:hypothetical protein